MIERIKYTRFAISCLIMSLAIWLFFPENGIVAQIPFICFAAIFSCRIFNNLKVLCLYSAFFSFLVAVLRAHTLFYGIVFALVMLAFVILGFFVNKLFKTRKVSSLIVFIFSLVLFTFLSGSFIGNIVCAHKNKEYIKAHGYDKVLKVNKTSFSFLERRYMTNVTFYDGESKMNAIISAGGDIVDGYFQYIEFKFLEKHRYVMSDILSENVDFDFASRSKNINTNNILSLSDDYNSYLDKMNFEIAFYKQVNKQQFAQMIEQCLKVLNDSNVVYESLTFFAGDTKGFLYQATIPYSDTFESMTAHSLVEDFDKKSFKNLNKEQFKQQRYGY